MKHHCLDRVSLKKRKLPVMSGNELIKLAGQLGYRQVRQRGCHVTMRRELPGSSVHKIIIPLHREIARGKLHGLLTEIDRASHIAKFNLVEMYLK